MNIKELNGNLLKKALGAKSVRFRWHNKNNGGGNFGINIRGLIDKDFQLTGEYYQDGTIRNLRFGLIFKSGYSVSAKDAESFESLVAFMKYAVEIGKV